jgi:hypothetical protein
MKYIEEFYIVGIDKLAISQPEGPYQEKALNGYVPWSGGSAIHRPCMTIQECRQYLFEYAKKELIRLEFHFATKHALIVNSNKKLGEDMFNLGQFKL